MVLRRFVAAVALALLISGTFTYLLARKLLKSREPGATLQYVVPLHEQEPGQVLKREDVKLVPWPANAPIAGALLSPNEAVGRAALGVLASGQPLSAKQLSPMGGLGLSARIPAGMRAISLKSDQVVGVAGFLLPGTHTDVLVTYRNAALTDAVTATVLQNAEVLAAGQKTQPDPEGKPSTVDVVTLLVSPDEAERVVLASSQGTVHFLLRNGADQQQASAAPINVSSLGLRVGLPEAALPGRLTGVAHPEAVRTGKRVKSSASVRQVAAPYSVVVVRGDKQTVETF